MLLASLRPPFQYAVILNQSVSRRHGSVSRPCRDRRHHELLTVRRHRTGVPSCPATPPSRATRSPAPCESPHQSARFGRRLVPVRGLLERSGQPPHDVGTWDGRRSSRDPPRRRTDARVRHPSPGRAAPRRLSPPGEARCAGAVLRLPQEPAPPARPNDGQSSPERRAPAAAATANGDRYRRAVATIPPGT